MDGVPIDCRAIEMGCQRLQSILETIPIYMISCKPLT